MNKIKSLTKKAICLLLCFAAIFLFKEKFLDIIDYGSYSSQLIDEKWTLKQPKPFDSDLFNQIASQKFTFLAEGGQSYAFLSENGKFVLKLFKFKRFNSKWYYSDETNHKRAYKLQRALESHKIAYENLQEQTALLFMQLYPDAHFANKSINITDQLNILHQIDLNTAAFTIQKFATPLNQKLSAHLSKGDLKSALVLINAVIKLFKQEHTHGYFDEDHGIMENIGFIANKPYHIDVGRFKKDNNLVSSGKSSLELKKISQTIIKWAKKNWPQYSPAIQSYLEQFLSNE